MKVAITARGQDKDALVDTRFGRAKYFLIHDRDADTWECFSNQQCLAAAYGAGIQAAQTVLKTGAQVLITGYVGPKAFQVLAVGNMAIYSAGEVDRNTTAEKMLESFGAGTLAKVTAPNPSERKK